MEGTLRVAGVEPALGMPEVVNDARRFRLQTVEEEALQ
jgi:hypothetical protein